MPNPLNPNLYRNLERVFGKVLITNEGLAFVGRYVPKYPYATDSMLRPRRRKEEYEEELYIESPGEYYRVNCDRCTDTRHRLYINHMWGKRDAKGRKNLWLATCYNDPTCYGDGDARQELYDRLSEIRGVLDNAPVKPGVVRREASVVDPPGPVVPLHELPPDHPANDYMARRFLDPERASRTYGVGYVADSIYTLARGRIYFPIHYGGELRGWQCRYAGDLDWKDKRNPPKSFNCPDMMRGQVLHGLDLAKRYRTGVLVEGPTSKLNFGPMAMATLGFPITASQSRMVVPHFKDESLVMLFDPDVLERPSMRRKYEAVRAELTKAGFKNGLAAVELPPGYDPADLHRPWLWEFVRAEAKAQNVKVSWEKR